MKNSFMKEKLLITCQSSGIHQVGPCGPRKGVCVILLQRFTYVCLLGLTENQKLVVRKFFALKEVILYYTDKLKNGGVRRQVIRDHATRRQVLC